MGNIKFSRSNYSEGSVKFKSKFISAISITFFLSLAMSTLVTGNPVNTSIQDKVSYPVAGVTLEICPDVQNSLDNSSDLERNQVDVTSTYPSLEERKWILKEKKKAEKIKTVDDYDFDKTGYTVSSLRIREKPNTESEILNVLDYNAEVKYSKIKGNKKWFVINYDGKLGYISADYISSERPKYRSMGVWGDSRKSYMDYTTITSVSSDQYKLQRIAYTEYNGIRAVNGRFCIAVGSYYSHNVGQYVDVVLGNGNVLKCIIGDCKKNKDTINGNSLGADGGAVEFIVQTSALNWKSINQGDVSYSTDGWDSNVIEIRLYDKYTDL